MKKIGDIIIERMKEAKSTQDMAKLYSEVLQSAYFLLSSIVESNAFNEQGVSKVNDVLGALDRLRTDTEDMHNA